jgi:hypothetical protein
MHKHVFNTVIALVALCSSSLAHAESGQVTGKKSIGSSWGTPRGDKWASVDLTFNSVAALEHDGIQADQRSAIGSYAWSSPTMSLLGKRTAVWNVESTGIFWRAPSLAGTQAAATGKIEFGGTSYYNCSFNSQSQLAGCEVSRSLNKTYVEGNLTYWIVGVVPVSIGGRINANLTAQVKGSSSTNSFSNAPASTTDKTFATMQVSGGVSGTAWVFLGLNGALGVGGQATVNLLRVTASGPWASAERYKCPLGGGCYTDNRVEYTLNSSVVGTSLDTLSGKITAQGCLGICGSETVTSWTGQNLSYWKANPSSLQERFASTY